MKKSKIYLFIALAGASGNAIGSHLANRFLPQALKAFSTARYAMTPSIVRCIAPSIATLNVWYPTATHRYVHTSPKLDFIFKKFKYNTNTKEKDSNPTQEYPFTVTLKQEFHSDEKYIIFAKMDDIPKVAMDIIDKKVVQKYIEMFENSYDENNLETLKKLSYCSFGCGNIIVEKHNDRSTLIHDKALDSLFYDTLSQSILDKKYDLAEFFVNESKYSTFEGHKSLTPFSIAIETEDITAIKILLESKKNNHITLSHYIYNTCKKVKSGEEFLCKMLDEFKLSPEFVNKLYNLIAHYVKPETVDKMQNYEERFSKETRNKKREKQANKLIYNNNDPFEIFGIKRGRTYSSKEISLIHKKLVLKYHPDANANKGIDTTEAMQKINAAYATLIMMYPV